MLPILSFLVLSLAAIVIVALVMAGLMIAGVMTSTASTVVNLLYFVLLVTAGYIAFGRPKGFTALPSRVRPLIHAALGGATLGILPGIMATWLLGYFPWMSFGGLDGVPGVVVGDWGMVVLIVFAAPMIEELIFRGWFWESLQGKYSTIATTLITSFLFAGYHIEPIHVLCVLPMGLWLGWVRSNSKTIYPGVLAHIANNGFAVATMLWAAKGFEFSLGYGLFAAFNSIMAGAMIQMTRED